MIYSFIAILIWASSFIAGKFSYSVADPVLTVQFRLLVAALIVAPAFRREYRRIPPPLRRRVWLLAWLNFPVVYLLQFIGLNYTSASSAVTIIGTEPLLIVLIGSHLFRERATPADWLGGLLAFIGIALIVLGDGDSGNVSLFGCLLVFGATLAFVFCVHWGKHVMRALDPATYTTTTIVLGALLCLPFTPLLAQHWQITPDPGGIAALLYLAIACSWLAVLLWNKGLQRISANASGILIALEPAFGVLFAVILLGEKPTVISWIGICLTLGATGASVLLRQKR